MGKHTWGNKYSTTAEWASSSSLQFLNFIPDHPISASNILLLQSVVEVHNARRQNRDINYYDCLEEIKNVLDIHMSTLILLIQFGGSLFQ